MKKPVKKSNMRYVIIAGIICILFQAVSVWHSITFNDSRLVKPIDVSEYTFQIQDLPMIVSTILLMLYVVYLFSLLMRAILVNKSREEKTRTTRRINPKLGFCGFFGLFGFMGFWTYSVDKTIFPFVFFLFFGFFGFFYEGKLSGTFMDERFQENRMKAHMKANQTAITIIFLATLIIGQGKLMGNLEYTLIAFVIVVALSLALEVFLSEYLLYRYDHDDQLEESEE